MVSLREGETLVAWSMAIFAASAGSTLRGMKVVFVKLLWRPLVTAKQSRIIFRCSAASGVALTSMRVSSAYYKLGQGR